MRIAVVANQELASADYRAYQPMRALAARGHDVVHVGGANLELAPLLRAEVVHVHRFCDEDMQAVVRRLGEAGVAVVWDNDDDVTDVPHGTRVSVRAGGLESQRRRTGIERMLRLVDLVTTPSAWLAERYRGMGAREVRTIENYVPDAFPRVHRRAHAGVVIGWTAAGEHAFDLDALGLRETLEALLAEHEDVQVASIGLRLGLGGERCRHVASVPFLKLAERVAEFDVGIAPIADIPFNRARSNVKLKEYASVGIPWLASPIGPYAGMGEREGGRLVPDGGWHEALERLVVRARERRRLARRAARWARRQTIGVHADEWEAALEEAVARARRGRG